MSSIGQAQAVESQKSNFDFVHVISANDKQVS